jgi:ApbE superfamily uncharacterized protein (UPF0280 family)
MSRLPQTTYLADGRRLHLNDGPIDLVIEANGPDASVRAAYEAAATHLTGLLDTLCEELPGLRAPANERRALRGRVARRMAAAVAPFADDGFITPMAAVAGAVAEEVLGAMVAAAPLERAYVNNGGDIALHLTPGREYIVGLIDRPDRPSLIGRTRLTATHPSRGVATSGRHGRSFSLGIADAVTVLARTAAMADAAATVIANAGDLPGHPGIERTPARDIQPDSDLGARPVTRDVAPLTREAIATALAAGAACARALLERGLIDGAALNLQGETTVVALTAIPD